MFKTSVLHNGKGLELCSYHFSCFGLNRLTLLWAAVGEVLLACVGKPGDAAVVAVVLGWDPQEPVESALACPLTTFIITAWSWREKVQQLTIFFIGFTLLPLSKAKNQQLWELLRFWVSHHCDDGSSPEAPAKMALFPPVYLLLSFVPPSSLPIPD